jgi:hypothetical protein
MFESFLLRAITLFEEERTKETLKRCKQEIRFYRLSFNVVSKNVDFLLEYSSEKYADTMEASLNLNMFRLVGLLQSIRILTLKGYYFEAKILTRNFWETIGLCVYLKQNPDKAELWYSGKKVEVPSIKLFNLAAKVFYAQDEDIFNRTYGLLCNYVHSNSLAVLSSVISDFNVGEKMIEGKPATGITVELPSPFDYQPIVDLALLPCAMLFAILYLFDDRLPKERKGKIMRFLGKEGVKFLSLDLWGERHEKKD